MPHANRAVMKDLSAPIADALQSVKEAGLRYASDTHPGIRRSRRGKDFIYTAPDGKVVKDAETLRRIRSLVIPPAWENVWIAPSDSAHLQATGRDARGRKQYRYHQKFRAVRDENKFGRMLAFAKAVPEIRRRVEKDLQLPGTPREKVLAGVVKLLETTLIRVGNDEYARTNKSYGLTTMHDGHAKIRGAKVTFDFKGKSGIQHSIDIEDPQLAKLVKRCQELPGQELFAYTDETGRPRDVGSQDVNEYLREITGENYTAKDFRTWAGTVLAAVALRQFEQFQSAREAKKNVVRAIEAVAKMLGNTPSVCRKCYVHPEVLDSYLEGSTVATLQQKTRKVLARPKFLKPEESEVVKLLQERLSRASRTSGTRTQARALTRRPASRTPRQR
jgi:DNA topoisomerase-1